MPDLFWWTVLVIGSLIIVLPNIVIEVKITKQARKKRKEKVTN